MQTDEEITKFARALVERVYPSASLPIWVIKSLFYDAMIGLYRADIRHALSRNINYIEISGSLMFPLVPANIDADDFARLYGEEAADWKIDITSLCTRT